MRTHFSKKLVIPIAAVAVLAGAGGAIAATQSSGNDFRQAYLNDLAGKLGVSPSTLSQAMKSAFEDQLNAAVAAGRLTQAQADAIKQRVEQGGGGLPFLGHGPGRMGFGMRGGPLHIGLSAAAQYLGISESTLRSDLASGRSLAQITASISGKTVAGLEDAITAAAKARLDKAVSRGRLTSQQEQQILSDLSSRLSDLVQRTLPTPPAGAMPGGGHRGWFGFHHRGASTAGSFGIA